MMDSYRFRRTQHPNPNSQQGSDETGIQIRCGLIWVSFFRDQGFKSTRIIKKDLP